MTAVASPHRLDASQVQPVRYCIDLWLRDEQIRLNTARVKARIEGATEKRTEPIAVVCFGPSLAETWEQVKGFQHVITCSGAHKFLVERGIIPTWHIEVDPRAHKTTLIGPPQPGVTYLIASTCHPKVLDHLDGYDVRLWHVYDPKPDAFRSMPHDEWLLTGGSSVGLRALTIARFLGFTDLHVFGMDGCEGTTGKHAAEHPNQPKGFALCEYEGVEYRTTQAMLECARQTWHELDQMPDVTATFYGNGLVQHMAQHYVPKPIPLKQAALAAKKEALISEDYREQNARLHRENLAYGVGGGKHAPMVAKLKQATQADSILDYGCGKGYLAKALDFPIWQYDPAIPELSESPRPADLVVCTDVLEHIEPERLPFVLEDLKRCVKKVGFFVIHTGPAQKTLADGRNAHLIQRGQAWWTKTLQQWFAVGKVITKGLELHVVVGPKAPKKGRVS